jgi:hypothetical protein
VLAVTFVGVMASDSLCPEHRAWVMAIATLSVVGVLCAFVALALGWASAPVLTFVSSIGGVAIGVLDAAHDPTRGVLIASGFAATAVLAGALAWRAYSLRRWDRTAAVATAPPDALSALEPEREPPPQPETIVVELATDESSSAAT